MSRLTDLIREAKRLNADLGSQLEREVRHLQERRAFGLNFERHAPEAVDLYGRPVRVGDKVRMLPPRGLTGSPDKRVWLVTGGGTVDGQRRANLRDPKTAVTTNHPVEDLVVVADNTDVIYPGLISTGKVECGGDKPYHTVINGENLHALKALLYTHRGRVDAIYIDPPYNSGARDWKYNNDYVDAEDSYRHSKWLAFMERRLRLAKELLKPNSSVLVASIDEKEYLRLGLLLEQVFPAAKIEMVTTVVNPRGRHRPGQFARSDEYLFFVRFGNAVVGREPDPDFEAGSAVPWRTLRRSDAASARGNPKGGPAQFFPIYITGDGQISSIGNPLPHGVPRESCPQIPGSTAVFPIRDSGLEMNWGLTAPALRSINAKGYVRVGRHAPEKPQQWEISYLTAGKIEDIETGRASVIGRNRDGSVAAQYLTDKYKSPTSTWMRASHNAEVHGTELLASLLPARKFPFPKSLYAVEDCLRLFLAEQPEGVVLDFFAGSGTTAHAVMRLNHADGGRRTCISLTNNEVSAEEQARLVAERLRPGDAEWEVHGICDYITKPRIAAAVTGLTSDGRPISGGYKFADEFPMADGLAENAEFFTLTYEAPLTVTANHSFERVAPLLWLRAGARGRRVESLARGWDVAESYGVIERLNCLDQFVDALRTQPDASVAFIITDDDRRFESACAALPDHVEAVRLYESYLRNFQIDAVRSSR